MVDFIKRSAEFHDGAHGLHRLRLDRRIGIDAPHQPSRIAFVGINPSVADDVEDDPTIRKIAGFCYLWKVSDFTVVNVFSRVATDVRELRRFVDMHPRELWCDQAERAFKLAILGADLVIPMWGSRTKVPKTLRSHIDHMAKRLAPMHKVQVFGHTASGDPMHPLMLRYGTPLVDWEV